MASWKVWVLRLSGLIRKGRECKQFKKTVSWFKVDNVL